MLDRFVQTTQVENWLVRFRRGDESVRDELIGFASKRLRRLTSSMLDSYSHVRRWEETDDVLNNALVRLHRALDAVRPKSVRHFYALAGMEIRRELIDMARHYFGPRGLGTLYETDGASPDTEGGSRHEVDQSTYEPTRILRWAEFHERVESLPDKEKEVFSLRWYGGLTFPEIGQVLEVTDRTAKRRWRSACKMLHEAMHGDAPGR